MIQIKTIHLDKPDIAIVKDYAKYVLDKFVKRSVQNKALIRVKVVTEDDFDNHADIDDLRRYRAWCTYDGVQNAKQINNKAKKPLVRLKQLLIDFGHELVHVKQYLNCEVFDYTSGGIRYKGSYFGTEYHNDIQLYYDSPWEIEAYGRELGLYKMYVERMKVK
jgi:hypothetical protein